MESETFRSGVLDSLAEQIAVIDEQGFIVDVNWAWKRFAIGNGAPAVAEGSVGINYLDVCRQAAGRPLGQEAHAVEAGIMAVLAGEQDLFRLEYPCDSPEEHRWFNLTVTPLRGLLRGAVISHQDITQRKDTEFALLKVRNQLDATLDAIPDLLFEVGLDGRIYQYRAGRTDLLAAPPSAFLGKLLSEFVPPEAATVCMEAVREASEKGRSSGAEYSLSLPQGERCFELSVATREESALHQKRFVVLARDVTERKQIQAQLLAGQELLRESALQTQAIQDNMADGVITIDAHGSMRSANKAATAIFGYPPEEVLGHSVSMLMSELCSDEPAKPLLRDPTTGELLRISASRNLTGTRNDGRVFPLSLSLSKVTQSGEKVLIAVVRDVTQARRDEEEIRRLAYFDPLTGLPNRRMLLDRLRHAMVTSARTQQRGAVMFLDLDHFKLLNDGLGHAAGDELLRLVAARLQANVRAGDSVARLGGDEFLILLEALSPNQAEAEGQAKVIADKLLGAVGQPYTLGDQVLTCTSSIGMVAFVDERMPIEDLIKQADEAMYQAKAAGRNKARLFDPDARLP